MQKKHPGIKQSCTPTVAALAVTNRLSSGRAEALRGQGSTQKAINNNMCQSLQVFVSCPEGDAACRAWQSFAKSPSSLVGIPRRASQRSAASEATSGLILFSLKCGLKIFNKKSAKMLASLNNPRPFSQTTRISAFSTLNSHVLASFC